MNTPIEANVNTNSRPSELRITDLRIANLAGIPMRCSIIRIDTNQGISGYGEVRDGASKTYALLLKNRIIGENPCNVDKIFRKIKQFGHHARQAGGVCGVEMALMDLAGKAYAVPAYQLAGGKFRDQVLCYCDTPTMPMARRWANVSKQRMDQGFKFLKMDVGVGLLPRHSRHADSASRNARQAARSCIHLLAFRSQTRGSPSSSTTWKLCARSSAMRSPWPWITLATSVWSRVSGLGRALDRFTLAWYEDMIPWQFADQWRQLTNSVTTPTCTGEDIYLKEDFLPLLEQRAVSIIHPDLASSGGILETKKIGDLAQEHGVAMAMHMAGSPISALANVHCAAATENFLVLRKPFG